MLPILAGCGGNGHSQAAPAQRTVRGPGFSFAVPADWRVTRPGGRVTASSGPELVQVAIFPLQRRYTDVLFAPVEKELAARLQVLARRAGGTLSKSSSVTAAGIRSHSYRIDRGGNVDEYTFVLRGKREFQLLCRRPASASSDACRGLLTSFRVL